MRPHPRSDWRRCRSPRLKRRPGPSRVATVCPPTMPPWMPWRRWSAHWLRPRPGGFLAGENPTCGAFGCLPVPLVVAVALILQSAGPGRVLLNRVILHASIKKRNAPNGAFLFF